MFRHILVLLDGSILAETALPPAADLSAALSAPSRGTLHLVSMLPFSGLPEVEEAIPSLAQRAWNNRRAYLQAISRTLHEEIIGELNLSVTTSVLTHPNVAEAIVHAAAMKRHGVETTHAKAMCDMIALTTHGRSGLRHLRGGSIAERILQETHLPLLVIHPALGERQANKTGSTPCQTVPAPDDRVDPARISCPRHWATSHSSYLVSATGYGCCQRTAACGRAGRRHRGRRSIWGLSPACNGYAWESRLPTLGHGQYYRTSAFRHIPPDPDCPSSAGTGEARTGKQNGTHADDVMTYLRAWGRFLFLRALFLRGVTSRGLTRYEHLVLSHWKAGTRHEVEPVQRVAKDEDVASTSCVTRERTHGVGISLGRTCARNRFD